MKIQICLFYQYISSYKFKPVFKCKQIDKKNFKTVNLKPENSKKKKKKKKKKKTFSELWKLEVVYFCTVKPFSSFSKLGAGSGGQLNNCFRPNLGSS